MAEIANVRKTEAPQLVAVAADSHGESRREPQRDPRRHPARPRSPEVAIALGEAVSLAYEVGDDGAPVIRVVDNERGETVALLSPEDLRTLTADTGLPPGVLVRLSS
ncbi:MAG: hypothetical protein IT299_05700 [Dehalococcoidia bacterium]|nr:hypothetical protein [Dehalococcoidia bacterium]